jgi:hypothetical protein
MRDVLEDDPESRSIYDNYGKNILNKLGYTKEFINVHKNYLNV